MTAIRAYRLARVAAWAIGIGFAVIYWYFLTSTGGNPADAHWYWAADPTNLYPHPELGYHNGYNYSPAFELVVGWGRLLPFDVFVAIWRAILLGVLVWLAGPLTMPVLLLVPVGSEVNAGNIQLLLAAAVVVGFRYPASWAFVILTKVTPGIGLLWFALRRQWRALTIAIAATLLVTVVTAAIWPDRWLSWLRFLTLEPPPAAWPYYSSIWQRLPFAIGFVLLGGWRGWRWPVVVAATLALPVFYVISPSLLVGCVPYLRGSVGRWVDRRAALGGPSSRVDSGLVAPAASAGRSTAT